MSKYPDDWDKRRRQTYQRDNYQCQRCHRKGGKRGDAELHAHHQTPIKNGGSHEISNLETVCRSCHSDIHGHPVGGTDVASKATDLSLLGILGLLTLVAGLAKFATIPLILLGIWMVMNVFIIQKESLSSQQKWINLAIFSIIIFSIVLKLLYSVYHYMGLS